MSWKCGHLLKTKTAFQNNFFSSDSTPHKQFILSPLCSLPSKHPHEIPSLIKLVYPQIKVAMATIPWMGKVTFSESIWGKSKEIKVPPKQCIYFVILFNQSNLMHNCPLICALQIRVEALIFEREIILFLNVDTPQIPPSLPPALVLYTFPVETYFPTL